jgi:hypothetical protein
MMNNEPQTKRRRDLSTVDDFYRLGKEVQNRSGQKLCVERTEDQCFREYFGCSVHTAINAWDFLKQHEKLGPGTDVTNMLWAMYFLKCYPLTQKARAAAGGADGAIDHKTWKKYAWPGIYSIADLEAEVVSIIFVYCILH